MKVNIIYQNRVMKTMLTLQISIRSLRITNPIEDLSLEIQVDPYNEGNESRSLRMLCPKIEKERDGHWSTGLPCPHGCLLLLLIFLPL